MTEPTPIDLPVGLRWVKLVCRLGRLVTDSAADEDAYPDLLPVGGTLTLAASPSRVRIQEADGRWRSVEVAGRTYTIRADGELVDGEGRVGVWIPDPASLLVEPQGYAVTAVVKPLGGTDWRVTFGGGTVLPDVVDLVAVSSVGSVSPSVTASLDARIYSLEQGGGVDVSQVVEDYLVANPPAAVADATTTTKGILRLAGDLGGTATAPTVPGLAGKADADHGHAIGDVTGLLAALDGKQASGSYAAATHDHTAADIDSGAATDGHVLTADGAGGAAWEAPPAGGGGSSAVGITADDTPSAPAEGESASYLVTSAVVWPADLVWSTDPDGGAAPTITGTALVSLFTVDGVTRAVMGATFSAGTETDPDPTDTTAPTWTATLTTGAPDSTSVTVAATALATDNVMVTGYESSVDSGATWQPTTPAGTVFTLTGLTPSTSYPAPQLRAKDAAGNTSTPLTAQAFSTSAAAASLSAAILAASPAGYWKLDEASGTTLADSSGNGRQLEVGTTPPTLAAHAGPAGTGSYPNFQNGASPLLAADSDAWSIDTTGDLTVMWLSRHTAADGNIRNYMHKKQEWRMARRPNATGILSLVLSPTSQYQQSEESSDGMAPNAWHLHMVVFSGTDAGSRHLQYRDSSVALSTTQGTIGEPQSYANGTQPLEVGSSNVHGLAHAAVFPTALSPAQISYIVDAARSEGWIA